MRHLLGPSSNDQYMSDSDVTFLLDLPNDEICRIELSDGEVFRLRGFGQVDDPADGWIAEVLELVRPTDDWSRRLYPVGSGVQFRSRNVTRIDSEKRGLRLYPVQNPVDAA